MRLITTDPEFTWNGTMFIVLGFTVWGTGQGIAHATRARTDGRWKVAAARAVGAVATLPCSWLPGIMAPTVVAGCLSLHRNDGITSVEDGAILEVDGDSGTVRVL